MTTKVNIFRKSAKLALQQGEEPTHQGELIEFGYYQRNYGEELSTVGIVVTEDGLIQDLPLDSLQIILEPEPASKPVAKPANKPVPSSKK